jgi:hypothetical protein
MTGKNPGKTLLTKNLPQKNSRPHPQITRTILSCPHRRKTVLPTINRPHIVPLLPEYARIEAHIMRSKAPYCGLAGLSFRPRSISPTLSGKEKTHPDPENGVSGVSVRNKGAYAPDGIRTFYGVFQKRPIWQTGHFTWRSGIRLPLCMTPRIGTGGGILGGINREFGRKWGPSHSWFVPAGFSRENFKIFVLLENLLRIP